MSQVTLAKDFDPIDKLPRYMNWYNSASVCESAQSHLFMNQCTSASDYETAQYASVMNQCPSASVYEPAQLCLCL